MNGWMDGWMDGSVDRWMDGWVGGSMGRWVGGRAGGWMDGWLERERERERDVYRKHLLRFVVGFFCVRGQALSPNPPSLLSPHLPTHPPTHVSIPGIVKVLKATRQLLPLRP